jgi:hypothetical protein
VRKTVVSAIVFFALFAACSDTMEETIYDKELEPGKFDHSRFGKARFK